MNTRRTRPTSPGHNPSEVDATPFAPVADSSDGSACRLGATLGDAGEGESGVSAPIHPFQGHRSDGSDYYSSGVYVNSKPTSSSPDDRSEHVEALGEWCDCNTCLRSRDASRARICEQGNPLTREEVALLVNAGLKGEIPLTTPVPVALSILKARRDRELDPGPPVGDRADIPWRIAQLRRRARLAFWIGALVAALALWLLVR